MGFRINIHTERNHRFLCNFTLSSSEGSDHIQSLRFNRLLFGNGLLANKGERCQRFSGYINSFIDVGEHHRRQRKMLNPVFSIAHMREMSSLILTPHSILFTLNSIPVPIFYNVTNNVSTLHL